MNHYFWAMGNGKIYYLFLTFLCGFLASGQVQSIQCTDLDRAELEKRLGMIREMEDEDPGAAIVTIGKSFLGTPYLAHSLENKGPEQLVVTFRGLDCTTFVENVLAFYLLHRKEDYSFDAFAQNLQCIRYRDGIINGYASRLHYFTEWIADNAKKGILEDMTAALGGKENTKYRNFMSRHRNAYSALEKDNAYQGVLEMETELEKSTYFVLAQEDIEKAESEIRNGDVIAFATSIKGLDVTHTGLAIRKGKRIHLLHASSTGQVEISDKTLADYSRGIASNTGIIVARVLE